MVSRSRTILVLVAVTALCGCAGAYVAGDTGAHHTQLVGADRP
ncbi:MAG TPA: hypothetical protein VFC47_15110 [Caulobacteraceae bacterium]|nr:hypothetical protein [Caulobacteraceae bacterium]